MHARRFTHATRWLALILFLALCAAVAGPAQPARAANTVTTTYTYTGAEQTFVVPQGVTQISVVAVGGKGGDSCNACMDTPSSFGGAGARVSSTLPVQPGQTLYVAVAGNGSTFTPGFNGGATNGAFYGIENTSFGGSAGGGASDIRTVSRADPGSLSSRLLVAGGGGGAGPSVSGGAAGQAGGSWEGQGGGAGTLTSGGAGGAAGTTRSTPGATGANGVFGSGGAGADAVGNCSSSGGGGGGGYYGGGGGGSTSITTFSNGCSGSSGSGGGGGGSSYVMPDATNVTLGLDTTGTPSITISYLDPSVPPTLSGTPPAGTYGHAYSFGFTVGGFPTPSLSVSGSLPPGLTLSGATLSGTPTQAGSFDFTLTASNGVAPDASLPVTIVVNPAALTASVTPATRQYSDPNPTFAVVFGGFVNGDDASVISGSPSCTTTAAPSDPAGQYPIICDLSAMSAANYTLPASASGALTVAPENAASDYTGDQFVLTAGPTTTTAPVRLAAQLTQEEDGYPGDITLAQVAFELYKSSNLGNTPDLVVGPVAVSAGGAAEAAATLAADTWTVKVKVAAGNRYWVANPAGVSPLTVALGDTARRVTGGGWVADGASANGKGNFGFTVSPDKKGNPRGNAQYVFRGTDGYTYVVKSTSWQGGGLTFFADPSRARFSGKAAILKIGATGRVVASQGNASFVVELVDGDALSPRQGDQYGITVRTSGGALWKQVALGPLGGGNVAVKSK